MSLNRDQIYETTVSLFIAWKNMGLAAKGTKILPACGMSWHWQIEKQTHYERQRERKREKNFRLNANSLKSNSGTRKTLRVSSESVKFT